MFRHLTIATFALATAFAPLTGHAQNTEQPDAELKTTNGAWSIMCSKENKQNCVMTQLGNRADGKPVLRVTFRKTPDAKTPDGKPIAAVVKIDAPLGVLLPAGVRIDIDGREIGRAQFQVCDSRACIASEPVPPQFVDQMKAGAKSVMTLTAVNGETAPVEISLNGFTKSFNDL